MSLESVEKAFSAFGPVMVTVIFGSLTFRITSYYNRVQADMAKEKLRRDLYDRRYAILAAAHQVVSIAVTAQVHADNEEGDSDLERYHQMQEGRALLAQARFLLDSELHLHLFFISATAYNLYRLVTAVGESLSAVPALSAKDRSSTELQLIQWDLNLPDQFERFLILKEM